MLSSALQILAQATPESDVVIQPETAPVSNAETQAVAGIGIGLTLFFVIFGIINFVFFIIAIIHLVKNEDVENRTLWIVLSLLVPFASWVYVLGPRRSYNKKGGSSQNPLGQAASAQNTKQWQSPTANAGASSVPSASQPVEGPLQPTPITPPIVNTQPQVAATPDNSVQQPPVRPQQSETVNSPSFGNSGDVSSTPTVPTPPDVTFPSEPGTETSPNPKEQDNRQFPPSNQV